MTRERRELILQFYESMLSFNRLVGPGHDAFLKAYGLTGSQMQLLYFLDKESPCTVKDVAGCMCTTSGAATQLIEGLVQMEYIERSSKHADRRYVDVAMTEKGTEFFAEFKRAHQAHLAELLEPLTDEELAHSTAIKEKVARRIQELKGAESGCL